MMMKRITALLLAGAMVFSMTPVNASAKPVDGLGEKGKQETVVEETVEIADPIFTPDAQNPYVPVMDEAQQEPTEAATDTGKIVNSSNDEVVSIQSETTCKFGCHLYL